MAEPIQTINAVDLPAEGTWVIDPGHAHVGFVGRHFGLTKVRGRFTGVSGAVVIAEDVSASTVEVTFDMATVDSGDETRDNHLRSDEMFDVVKFPTATFRSTHLSVDGAQAVLDGELTIKGVSNEVSLNVDYVGSVRDPWGNDRAVFHASGNVNREDWGLTWNMVLEAGGLLVSKEVRLEIEVELIRQPN